MLLRVLLFVLVASCVSPVHADDYAETGPLGLLITYRCEARHRPAFRRYLEGEGLARFEAWKRKGVLAEYRIFFNWYVDEKTWDAMAMVRFAEWADVAKWKEIEETMPGGLPAEALALASPVTTSSADVGWEKPPADRETSSRESVYLLIPYRYLGSVDEYKEYVDGYVIPQLDGWVAADALRSYEVLLNRFPTGDRWGAMLVLEYKDHEAFGRRKFVKNEVRKGLRDDPVWKAFSDRKKTIREEREPVICERLLPNP